METRCADPIQEVEEIQGIKIWKRGKPTNAYTALGQESLHQATWPEARNRIALGVRARKGNAAILNSMIPVQRADLALNTGVDRLDGFHVRYTVILLRP